MWGLGWTISCSRENQIPANQYMQVKNQGPKFLLFFTIFIFLLSGFTAVGTVKKGVGYESPLCDRLVYLTTCLLGHHVEVQVKNGSIYSGIFHAANAEKDFGMYSENGPVQNIMSRLICLLRTCGL